MGLDMYLEARRYLSDYDEGEKEIKKKIEKIGVDNAGFPIKEITVEAMYWRKVNAIHAWFVRECQKGVDDCRPSYVGREKLRELLDLCKQVLKKHSLAEELLPSQSGFFFGATEYDKYYFADIKETVDGLTKLLGPNGLDETSWEFHYRSSW